MALPRAADRRLVLAVDVTSWLRPEAHTSPARMLCHIYGRGKDAHIMVPGWPYSLVCALETGRHSWTAPLDAQRLAPGDDAAAVTAAQLRRIITDLIAAGQWQPGDPDILIVADAGYDGPRLAFLLDDLPVALLVRMRPGPAPPAPTPHARHDRAPPPPRRRVRLRRPGHLGPTGHHHPHRHPPLRPDERTCVGRLHPRLTRRSAWITHAEQLPVLERTVIRLEVARLPSGAIPKPVWLWYSRINQTAPDMNRLWQAFLRRFDIEHTFRLFKQTLGWTAPKLRTPEAADRWTWLILAAYTQLRLARRLAVDLRRPWEKPTGPDRLTPARVRRGFRYLRPQAGCPANAPKPARLGPRRPAGRRNRRPADRHDVHIVTATTTTKTKSRTPRPRRTGQNSS